MQRFFPMQRFLMLWGSLVCTMLATVSAQSPSVSLAVVDRPLQEVLLALGGQTGIRFTPLGEVRERRVTVRLERASLSEALRQLRALARCAFVRFAGGYFVVPLFPPEELRRRLAEAAHPERIAGTLTLSRRTSWGWQPVTALVRFQAPDRALVELPDEVLWTEGTRSWRWDKTRRVVVEGTTPLLDWTDSFWGIAAVPAFGHGWAKVNDWQPTEVSATTLRGRPVWVLTLTRKGQVPRRPTFLFLRVTLANTMYAPYLEAASVPWRVRCFVDCATQGIVRREVYDPQGRPLQVVAADPLTDKPLPLTPHRFEVLDSGLTVVVRGEWRPQGTTSSVAPPELPTDVLRADAPVARQLAQAEQVWLNRDDGDTALQLLRQAVAQTNHPAALASAASLLARLNRLQEAWQCLQKMGGHLGQFAEAVALAVQLADALGRWSEVKAWLQEQAEPASPAVWMALAYLAEVEAWQRGQLGEEPMGWYARTLRHIAATLPPDRKTTASPTPEERATAWAAAQRLFTWAWGMGRMEKMTALAQELLGTPAEPLGQALLAWAAMERGDEGAVKEHLRQLQDHFADWTALRLAMAELAESYGLTAEAEGEYRRLLSEVPMFPEGLRAREHWLRRLVEADRAEEAVRFFLDSLRAFGDDWAKSGWAETFREMATTALRHNRIAYVADTWRQQKVSHPENMWLYDLMARFSESEGDLGGAMEMLHQATLAYPRLQIFAARWCQVVLRLHSEAQQESAEVKTAARRQWAQKRLAWMDERLRKWRQQFADQPFFAWLFVFTPNLMAAYEENPAAIRQQVREFLRRAKEIVPSEEAERQLLEALTLLNNPANWLDAPGEVRNALLRLERLSGVEWHGLRVMARQLFATFNGVQPDLRQFLPFLDGVMDRCLNEVERVAIAQNALQALTARQQWQEAVNRLHRWLQFPGSDLYRRSLLAGWRNSIAPFAADERSRPLLQQVTNLLPDDPIGWVLRAEVLETMGSNGGARKAYQQALQRADADWLWQLYGEAALRWGELELAEKALERAMARTPHWERTVLWLQTRLQREHPPEVATLRRLVAHFGWRWQLLSMLAGAVGEPSDAFRWGRLAERGATMDPSVSRLQKFWIRLNLVRWALQAGHQDLAQFWLGRLRQPEAPEEIRAAADALARQSP